MSEDFLLLLIVSCEIGFWVVLLSALMFRYVFRFRRLSTVLLIGLPLIDLILLTATVIDLRGGAVATLAHGLAAAYIGFTVSFGKLTISWADRWFAHRFASAPALLSPPSRGWAGIKYELVLWGRCLLGVIITLAQIQLAITLIGQPDRTEELARWYGLSFWTVVLWFVFGPVWSLVFAWRKPKP